MEPDRKSEIYTADYGNLALDVSSRATELGRLFEYTVTDQADGCVCWAGSASNLASAQSEAILEAQIFLDPYISSPLAPELRHHSGRRPQI
jgi:hypothetical protein